MIRPLISLLIVSLVVTAATGQQNNPRTTPPTNVQQDEGEVLSKPELLRHLALLQAAQRDPAIAHANRKSLVKLYSSLGAAYEALAMYPKAESAMQRAIFLMKDGPKEPIAEQLGHLSLVHSAMGKVRDAESDQLQALVLRESQGDPIGIALTWNDLADLYVKKRQFKKALDYAQRAMDVLGDCPTAKVSDRLAVRQTLALALCGMHNCQKAIPLLQSAVRLAMSQFGVDSLQAGIDEYLLGYVDWQSHDLDNAAVQMKKGIALMKPDLGWGSPIYVNAMAQYAQFLRKHGPQDEAVYAQSEVRRAQSVVDARSFTH